MPDTIGWQWFALGSAFFAGLTAILGKLGVTEINSNLATLIRTVVIMAVSALVITWRGEWEPLNKLSGRGVVMLCLGRGNGVVLAVLLSGAANRAGFARGAD